jgi:hypothetical protein
VKFPTCGIMLVLKRTLDFQISDAQFIKTVKTPWRMKGAQSRMQHKVRTQHMLNCLILFVENDGVQSK